MTALLDYLHEAVTTKEDVDKVKNLILQLAMRGKLVEQDPTDEPASVLLEKIKEEKEQLIRGKKIKKEKPLPEVSPDEIPYELPKGWEWVRLNEIALQITDGVHHKPTYLAEGIPFLSVKDVSKGFLDFSNVKYISEEEHEELTKRCKPEFGDILLTKIGTTGIAKVIDTKREFSIFVSLALLKIVQKNIYPLFLEYALNSPLVKRQSQDGTEGVGNKNLVLRKIKNFMIPLPPLNEQKRIIVKIEELLEQCDQLSAELLKKKTQSEVLNKSVLTRIKDHSNPYQMDNLRFALENIEHLCNDKASIDQLRNSLLSLAVQGKLVEQDTNDESASVLLEKIKEEKSKLIKEKKIKKEKSLPPIIPEEVPYELPKGWEWVRLGEITTFYGGFAFKSNSYVDTSEYQIIRLGNVKNNKLLLSATPAFIPEEIARERDSYLIKDRDILVTMTGTRGKRDYFYTCLVEYNSFPSSKNLYLNQRVGCLRSLPYINPYLVNMFLKSDVILDSIFETETGTANQGNIGSNAIRELLFPLPPMEEQQRIVEKITALLNTCDRLELQLNEAIHYRGLFLKAILQSVFS